MRSLLIVGLLLAVALTNVQGATSPNPQPITEGTTILGSPHTVGSFMNTQNWTSYFQSRVVWSLESRPNATTPWNPSSDLVIVSKPIVNGLKYTLKFSASCTCFYRLNITLPGIQSRISTVTGYNLTETNGNHYVYSYADITGNSTLRIFPTNNSFTAGVFKWSISTPIQILKGIHFIIDPSVVGTSTNNNAVFSGFQRKLFYASGRFWMVYYDGGTLGDVYTSSVDGITWASPTQIHFNSGSNGGSMSIAFDGTNFYYAFANGGGNLFFREGVPNGGGVINWLADEQTVDTTANEDYPTIAIDSNGFAWIGELTGLSVGVEVYKNANKDGTWSTAPGFPYSPNNNYASGLMLPLLNGQMYVAYGKTNSVLKGRLYNGTAWQAEDSITTSNAGNSNLDGAFAFSAVSSLGFVYLIFSTTTDIRYVSRTTGSWSGESVIATSNGLAAESLTLDTTASIWKLYAFWDNLTANTISYATLSVGGTMWSGVTLWITETNLQLNNGVSFLASSPSTPSPTYIGYAYEQGSASPYNVKFAFLSLSYTPATTTPSSTGGIQPPPITVQQFGNATFLGLNFYTWSVLTFFFGSIFGFGMLAIVQGRREEAGAPLKFEPKLAFLSEHRRVDKWKSHGKTKDFIPISIQGSALKVENRFERKWKEAGMVELKMKGSQNSKAWLSTRRREPKLK